MKIAASIGLAVLPLLAQTTVQDPVIRVSVDLVQVDATVTDAQGRHVADLKPEDFAILEDGKPQKITHFSYVHGMAMPEGSPGVAAQQPGQSLSEPSFAPAKALTQEQVHRTIVMIADDLGLASDDIPNVRRAMKKFVDSQMQPGDLVSIMTTSGGMGAIEQLTNDKSRLYAAIDHVRYLTGRSGQTWYQPTNCCDGARKVQTESEARLNAIRSPTKVVDTLGAVAFAIQGLRDMPGRKAIALFSDGFARSAGGIAQLANRASVVLYTFDPRGLASYFLTAVDIMHDGNGAQIRAAEGQRQAVYRATQRGLEQLARETGGVFFHDNNELERGLAAALEDMSSYYLIGYQPQRDDFNQVRGVAPFHKIEVKVLRAGLKVRSRNGFVGTPDPPAASEGVDRKSGKEELRKALFSPFHANGFPVHLSAFYSAAMGKDPKTGRHPTVLRATLAIDANGLRFSTTQDGKKELNIEVIAAAYGANNEAVASSDKTFTAAMTESEMKQTIASGLVYGLDIRIPKPGPYQLRVAVWDANSEQTGSAATFVEIPDFNRPPISLSSVLLRDSDPKRNEDLTHAGVIGAGSPVTRMFAPGAELEYDCTVFGALTDRQTGKPKVAIEVRLFRGPEQIFTGQPIPLAIADGNSASAIHATGKIRLPATLPPGDYVVELSAYDQMETKQSRHAAQWADFTLVSAP